MSCVKGRIQDSPLPPDVHIQENCRGDPCDRPVRDVPGLRTTGRFLRKPHGGCLEGRPVRGLSPLPLRRLRLLRGSGQGICRAARVPRQAREWLRSCRGCHGLSPKVNGRANVTLENTLPSFLRIEDSVTRTEIV